MKTTARFNQTLIVILVLALFSCHAPALADQLPGPDRWKSKGPYSVDTLNLTWFDKDRDREVPVKIYYPKSSGGSHPVVIFSHGLGGTREGAAYLGEHWASHGYVSVHLQHKGSDAEVLKAGRPMKAMREAIRDRRNAVNRPKDVSFAIYQIEKLNREESPVKGEMDLARIGMAGHSFGAFTTLAVAGQVFVVSGRGRDRTGEISFAEPRIKAAIPMSAPVPRTQEKFLDKAYARITIPCLHMTGTKDVSLVADTPVEDRRIPFDRIDGADQYLITFKDGDHLIFSGWRPQGKTDDKDPMFHELIRTSSTAFWDAYLKEDKQAKEWLAHGGFDKALGGNGRFEKKLPEPKQQNEARPHRWGREQRR